MRKRTAPDDHFDDVRRFTSPDGVRVFIARALVTLADQADNEAWYRNRLTKELRTIAARLDRRVKP